MAFPPAFPDPPGSGLKMRLISLMILFYILRRAERICARDRESADFARQVLGAEKDEAKVVFCPEVAFTLEKTVPGNVCMEPLVDMPTPIPYGGLNVSGLLYNGGNSRDNMFNLKADYRRLIVQLARWLLGEPGVHLLLQSQTWSADGFVDSDPQTYRKLQGH